LFSNKMELVDEDVSINHLIRQLEADTIDLDNSLEKFVCLRSEAISLQKRALARYEEEMFQIEESSRVTVAMEEQRKANIDHNIFKHLNIDVLSEQIKRTDTDPLLSHSNTTKAVDEPNLNYYLIDHNSFIERNKKVTDMYENLPPPTFEQKKQVRESMFAFLEESSIEETRLEIEIEQAKLTGDFKSADELADALFLLQKINNDRLNNIIAEYRPQPANRTWGGDPEYAHLSKQLVAISEAYSVHDSIDVKRR